MTAAVALAIALAIIDQLAWHLARCAGPEAAARLAELVEARAALVGLADQLSEIETDYQASQARNRLRVLAERRRAAPPLTLAA